MARAALLGLLFALVAVGRAEAADMDQTGAPPPDLVAHALNLNFSQMARINAAQADLVKATGLDVTCLCPTCPHRTIHDCDCGWAVTNKRIIEAAIAQGYTRDQIVTAYRKAYGDQVLAMIPNEGFAVTAWAFPIAAGVAGLGIVIVFGIRRRRAMQAQGAAASSAPAISGREATKRELMRELEEMD